ncbi:MAG: aminopeptidase [Chloroflexota bacterium]
MTDIRLQRLADLLVNYCTEIQAGDYVIIRADVSALEAARLVYAAVVEAGAHPSVSMGDEAMSRIFLRDGVDAQLNWLNPTVRLQIEQANALISLRSTVNTRAMTGIDPKRMQQTRKAQKPVIETYMKRSAAGDFKWTLTQYPTEGSAQEANMSLEEYADFVHGATFCDHEDPVAKWQEVNAMQQEKVDWLKGKKQVKLSGPNIDLELSIEDRIFINANGQRNMPDGEIFTGPVEDSVNGWVRYSYPTIVGGRMVKGIELKFEGGKVVEASADQNEELLLAQLDTDPGARYLGEFAIGTNFGINQFTGNILFDEKIGGTIHTAIGASYPDTGGKNESAVHWDMICDMREDSEIHVDGDLFYKNGEFVV